MADHIPELRIVIDHLPSARVPSEGAAHDSIGRCCITWRKTKMSSSSFLGNHRPNRTSGGPTFNQETLGALWDLFGEDHVLYASDWPNSDHHATYAETFTILNDFAKSKSRQAEEKFFWKNSVAAYRWHRRQADQPMLQEKV